jgi:hypothetical protein
MVKSVAPIVEIELILIEHLQVLMSTFGLIPQQ